ncbi:MAG: KUP/HAK/KT family potassium transporter [Deltaproteobacteria bacterium]|nr:KUP/HAK/KT family potassium transporter [Deltaproteobacteria bacterium]
MQVPSSIPSAPPEPEPPSHAPRGRRALALTSLGALGVVYGDIGTSPLYAIKECLAWHPQGAKAGFSPHAVPPDLANVLGVLSLVFWALVLVICVKYLLFVLRADNKGEGGILALAALVSEDRARPGKARLALPILLGLFGTGLLFGDGAITPAISVLGAVEGLSEQSPALGYLVVPITVGILIVLFLVQRLGTGRIGFAFGPVMMVWFLAIGAIGAFWLLEQPVVLQAVNPAHGVRFLAAHGATGFVLIGLVFLVVTGGEALYADMGHFGRRPIRIAWFAVALPALLLNYFGQGAVLLSNPPGTIKNPFYEAASIEVLGVSLLIPMLGLAMMAAVIAAQALISGVFSITRQAMQLGFWPRVTVVHTSATTEGQIYIPEMNWLLMASTIAVVLQFRTSSALAAAYGIAVTGTMAITSYLFYLVCIQRWGVSRTRALLWLIPFLAIDLAFFGANIIKVLDGGWFPLAIGAGVFLVMTTWWRGRTALAQVMDAGVLPDAIFLADVVANPPPRVRGTAVFMSSNADGIPNVLLHHMKHNQVLHRQVILFSIELSQVPWIDIDRTVELHELGHGFFRILAKVGFMQSPDVPKLLAQCAAHGVFAEASTTTYYLGRQTLLTSGRSNLARWRKLLFSFLARNARPPTAFFNLPPNRVVELGLQIEM